MAGIKKSIGILRGHFSSGFVFESNHRHWFLCFCGLCTVILKTSCAVNGDLMIESRVCRCYNCVAKSASSYMVPGIPFLKRLRVPRTIPGLILPSAYVTAPTVF